MNVVSRPCADRELLLHGLADSELDAANSLQTEEHLRTCSGCAAAYEEILFHKKLLENGKLSYNTSAAFRGRILSVLAKEGMTCEDQAIGPSAKALSKDLGRFGINLARLNLAVSAIAVAAALLLFVNIGPHTEELRDEFIAGHIRSMLASHLTDVASSDQHTVKPWFLGKLNFSPPVLDLSSKDFPLLGGRLDYIGGRVVAALVYKRHGHVINLFIWPGTPAGTSPFVLDGYNLLSWTAGPFAFAAVSDLNLTELTQFKQVWLEHT